MLGMSKFEQLKNREEELVSKSTNIIDGFRTMINDFNETNESLDLVEKEMSDVVSDMQARIAEVQKTKTRNYKITNNILKLLGEDDE